MPSQTAAVLELTEMGSNPMNAIPPDIAGDYCETCDSQRLVEEDCNLFGLEMMEEEIAGDDVEAARSKRQ